MEAAPGMKMRAKQRAGRFSKAWLSARSKNPA